MADNLSHVREEEGQASTSQQSWRAYRGRKRSRPCLPKSPQETKAG